VRFSHSASRFASLAVERSAARERRIGFVNSDTGSSTTSFATTGVPPDETSADFALVDARLKPSRSFPPSIRHAEVSQREAKA